MGAGACTPPVVVAPIAKVVAAFAVGARPVGDFVPVETGDAEHTVNQCVAAGQNVFVRYPQFPAPDFAGHGCAVFHDQGIGGYVIHFSGEHGFEGGAHVVVGFAGGAVDHVQVDVLESGGAGFFRRLHGPPWGVAAFQYLQDTAGRGLHAQRHPRVARL